MQGIKQAIADSVENRVGDGRSSASVVRCVIWSGKMLTINGSVEICPGYDKITTSVWCVPKDRFTAFIRGRWRPENLDTEIARLRARIGFSDDDVNRKEFELRRGEDAGVPHTEIDPSIGVSTKTPGSPSRDPATHSQLWTELAFYELEVKRVELAPHEEDRIPGGIINANTAEVQVAVNGSGKFESVGAKLILNPLVDRMVLNQVPRGAGIKPEELNRQIRIGSGKGSNSRTSDRVSKAIENIDWRYRSRCGSQDPEVSLQGDIWHEGVRSSLTRGLFEVWVDDLRMGPMLRVSRQLVQESNARYQRYTAAAQQRYATERDHPVSADIASSGLTPVKTYIEDWFGDPNLYFGLAQFLLQLSSGTSDNTNKQVTESFDLGVFDYGKIYNRYEGLEI